MAKTIEIWRATAQELKLELQLLEDGHAFDRPPRLTLVPNYLRNPAQYINHHRIRRALDRIPDLFDLLPQGQVDWAAAITAILYADGSQRGPYFEQAVKDGLEARMNKDRADNDLKLWDRFHLDVPTKDPEFVELGAKVGCLILWHKIALLTCGYRLPPAARTEIVEELSKAKTNMPTLALVAAACYDIPNEHTRRAALASGRDVIARTLEDDDAYANERKNKYRDPTMLEESRYMLFDLPICTFSQDYRREGLDHEYANPLFTFVDGQMRHLRDSSTEKEWAEKVRWYTFNHEQSKTFAFALKNWKEAGPMRIDIHGSRLHQYELGDGGNNAAEFRMKRAPLLLRLLGVGQQDGAQRCPLDFKGSCQHCSPEHPSGCAALKHPSDCLRVITCLHRLGPRQGTPDSNGSKGNYPIPLNSYVPVPLVNRLLSFLKAYFRPDFQPFTITFYGMEDRGLASVRRFDLPKFDASWNSVYPASPVRRSPVATFLAATVTNVGMGGGFGRLSIADSGGWREHVQAILQNRKSGYEILLRYIETYMRCHDVSTSSDDDATWSEYEGMLKAPDDIKRKGGKGYAIGVDIGATSIKLSLFELNAQDGSYKRDGKERRAGVKSEGAKWTPDTFARHVSNEIWKLLGSDTDKLEQVDVIGVCWPGILRKQKIAGASGILGKFDESVASNLIRENTVEKLRDLDIVGALRNAIAATAPNGKAVTVPVIGLSNDGYAEAIGRIFHNDDFRKHRWAVLKAGTGTAGAIIDKGIVREGPQEFGKLVLNIHEEKEPGDDRLPDGVFNKYVSANLFPRVFHDMAPTCRHCGQTHEPQVLFGTAEVSVQSYIIGRLASLLLGNDTSTEALTQAARDIGTEVWYVRGQHFCTKEDLGALLWKRNASAEPHGHREVLEGFRRVQKRPDLTVEYMCKEAEEDGWRCIEAVWRAALDRDKGPDPKAAAERMFRDDRDDLNTLITHFQQILDRSGSLLADAIKLLHDLYAINGVILCGGVFSNPVIAERVFNSIQRHLESKYHVYFASLDDFREDDEAGRVGKLGVTTIYHQRARDKLGEDQDCATAGSMFHAKIQAAVMQARNSREAGGSPGGR